MVPAAGLEPASPKATDFKSVVSTKFHQAGLLIAFNLSQKNKRVNKPFKNILQK